MKHWKFSPSISTVAAIALAALATPLMIQVSPAHETRETHPAFSYAGGTEAVPENCSGQLEVSQFRHFQDFFPRDFHSEFRPNESINPPQESVRIAHGARLQLLGGC